MQSMKAGEAFMASHGDAGFSSQAGHVGSPGSGQGCILSPATLQQKVQLL